MAKHRRDDFSSQVKRTLERRVNSRCSNPDHRVPTSGPTANEDGVSNIGKAAHIAAAAPGGPRYDPSMTRTQRSGLSNGIWLCANCSDMIDKDELRYPTALLHDWKRKAEALADAEKGKPQPSVREFAVYKAKALGEHVGTESVTSLVDETLRVGRRMIESIDPRFTATIRAEEGRTHITLIPLETIPCKLHIPSVVAEAFSKGFDELHRHGLPLEISAPGLKMEGSPLFEQVVDQPRKLVIESALRTEATHRLFWTDPDSGRPMTAEFAGQLVAGTESITFTGSLFDGLCGITYRLPRHHEINITVALESEVTAAPWNGQSARRLPHFEKYRSLCKTIAKGGALLSSLEAGGRELFSTRTLLLMSETDAQIQLSFLNHLSRLSSVLEVMNSDVAFQKEQIREEDLDLVFELWSFYCDFSTRHGADVGEVTFSLVPSTAVEAQFINDAIKSGRPTEFRIEQQRATSVTLFGQQIHLKPITLTLSDVLLRCEDNLPQVEEGTAAHLSLVPTADTRTYIQIVASAAENIELLHA